MKRHRARRVTLQVRKAMFKLLCDPTGEPGSSLAELCQAMILTGSIHEYMRLDEAEHLRKFVAAAQMSKVADGLNQENPFRSKLTSFARTQSNLVNGPTRNGPHIDGSELLSCKISVPK
jgi:hypothetical protein